MEVTRRTSDCIADTAGTDCRWPLVPFARLFFDGDSVMGSFEGCDGNWMSGEGLRIRFFPVVLAN